MKELQQIISELSEGKKDAFWNCYKKYRNDFVEWAVHRFNCTHEDAKDGYQELMIRFYEKLKGGKLTVLTSSLKTYLFQIGKYVVINELNKKRHTVTFQVDELINGIENPFEMSDNREHHRKVVEVNLSKLPEKDQEVLRLYYIEEKSMKEIAKKMGYKNADVAKKSKYEAFKKLAKLVKGSIKTFMLL